MELLHITQCMSHVRVVVANTVFCIKGIASSLQIACRVSPLADKHYSNLVVLSEADSTYQFVDICQLLLCE